MGLAGIDASSSYIIYRPERTEAMRSLIFEVYWRSYREPQGMEMALVHKPKPHVVTVTANPGEPCPFPPC